nr:hypothetical protein [uncultured Gellertiella sp.]
MTETKNWYQSKAVWGAIAALAATLIRATGHDPGIDGVQQLADGALNAATGIGALLALYGRISATGKILR